MNGKYMRWAEQRWNDRNEERLERMKARRRKKENAAALAAYHQTHRKEEPKCKPL